MDLHLFVNRETGKGKFISGAADFGAALQHGAVMAFITDRNY